jgi:hypothetical protein
VIIQHLGQRKLRLQLVVAPLHLFQPVDHDSSSGAASSRAGSFLFLRG